MRPMLVLVSAMALISVSVLNATETTTFSYDALGRLQTTSNSGGPRDARVNSTRYDPAGNRQGHASGQPLPPTGNVAIFSISGPATITEAAAAVYTISKTGPSTDTLSVNIASADGSATAPADYGAVSATLSFRAWETVKTITLPIAGDSLVESAEQFSVALSAPSTGASISTGAVVTVIDGASNQPPTTQLDNASMDVCRNVFVNVVANDTDAEGNVPITLIGVSHTGGLGNASVSSATTVRFQSFGATGVAGVSYTVRDSLGATSTGQLEVLIQDLGGCN